MDGPREKWKPNLTVIKAVTRFVLATGRLQPKTGVDYNVEEKEREVRSESEGEVTSSSAYPILEGHSGSPILNLGTLGVS
jgi:hypothetical protein